MYENLRVLDCTLRDGGYVNNWSFTVEFAQALFRAIDASGADYIELGFIDPTKSEPVLFKNFNRSLVELITGLDRRHVKVALMVNYSPKLSADCFPHPEESGASMLRIAVHRHERESGARLAADLSGRGYETTVNFMGISNYSNAEVADLGRLIASCRDGVSIFYLADSFGSLTPTRTTAIIKLIRAFTDASLGFHPHNNLQLAFANTLAAVDAGVAIVDGSVYGMGRGGGNLHIETLLVYLNQVAPERFNALPVLDFTEIYMERLRELWEWGYSLPQVISAALGCHPNYASEMLRLKSYGAREVFEILKNIPTEKRSQFDAVAGRKLVVMRQIEQSKQHRRCVSFGLTNVLKSARGKVLLVCGGASVAAHKAALERLVTTTSCAVVSVNNPYCPVKPHAVFFGNARRLIQYASLIPDGLDVIVNPYLELPHNLHKDIARISRISLEDFGSVDPELGFPHGLPTNSGVEAILAMAGIGFKEIFVAGMDGFSNAERGRFFYSEIDALSKAEDLAQLDQAALAELAAAKKLLSRSGASFGIVTPTVYNDYALPIEGEKNGVKIESYDPASDSSGKPADIAQKRSTILRTTIRTDGA